MKFFLILTGFGFFQMFAGSFLEAKTAEEWYAAGFEQSLKGKNHRAVQSYQKALRLKPGWAKAHHSLGVLFYRLQDGVQSVHHLRQAEKNYAKDPTSLAQKNLFIVRKNLEKAYTYFELDPGTFEKIESVPPPVMENWLSSGTGFLFGSQGYLLTLHHFVEEAGSIRVRLADGTILPANLVKAYLVYNLALLKLKNPLQAGPPPLELGDSSSMKLGDPVYIVGDGSLTVQGSLFSLSSVQDDKNFFEIKMSLDKKHSGSPALNAQGQVIGITMSKSETMKAFQAMGREPEGEIALKSSYLQNVLRGVSGLTLDIDKSIPNIPAHEKSENFEEFSGAAKRNIVRVEISR